jgi:transcriptional regulator with XRE-family HTH domain
MSPQTNRFSQYLKARREQLKPEDVGFPRDPDRRVKGLKREEVAILAGISPEYYTRLEQGRSYQLSEQVLSGLTRALKLDSYAAAYFYRLALPEAPVQAVARTPVIDDQVRQLVAGWSDVPVCIFDRNQDVLLLNNLMQALFPRIVPGSNTVMTAFSMAPEYRATPQWRALARGVVGALRFYGDPADPRLHEIVGELSIREPVFRTLWAEYDAVPLDSGVVPANVPGFGLVDFPWQNLRLANGLFMGVWAAAPGSPAEEVIDLHRRQLGSRLIVELVDDEAVEGERVSARIESPPDRFDSARSDDPAA